MRITPHKSGKEGKNPSLFLLLPQYLAFIIEKEGDEILFSSDLYELQSQLFIKDLMTKPVIQHAIPFFNILIFGVAGCGKSSFINSVLTLMSNRRENVVPVGGDTTHVTQDLSRFQVSQITNFSNFLIHFFDLWGLDKENYTNYQLVELLLGNLPENTGMRECVGTKVEEGQWSAYQRCVHVLLFFIFFLWWIMRFCLTLLKRMLNWFKINAV